jgi:ssDNA-binding Zn-finger/Zn-ribbon topoisomerase 1
MSEKKEVVLIDRFSICPHCGKTMALLQSKYTMYMMLGTSNLPNKVIGQEEDYTMACTCGFRVPMVKTMNGFYPRDHYKVEEEEKLMNEKPADRLLIGYIDEGE